MKNLRSDLPNSASSPESTHPLTGVVAAVRRVALILLLAGVAETAVWYGNARLASTPGGAFTNIALGVIAGTFFLGAIMAVLAYIVDLLIFVNSNKTTRSDTAESRPLTAA